MCELCERVNNGWSGIGDDCVSVAIKKLPFWGRLFDPPLEFICECEDCRPDLYQKEGDKAK
jgi:hypothetical protein